MSNDLMDAMARRIQALESRNARLLAMVRELYNEADRVGSVSIDKGKSTHCRLAALIREGEGKG